MNSVITTTESHYDNLVALRVYVDINRELIEPHLNMEYYRDSESLGSLNCKTAGCILGHAIAMPRFAEFYKASGQIINFADFSEQAFGIKEDSMVWDYLFGPTNPNAIDPFLERLEKYFELFDLDTLASDV